MNSYIDLFTTVKKAAAGWATPNQIQDLQTAFSAPAAKSHRCHQQRNQPDDQQPFKELERKEDHVTMRGLLGAQSSGHRLQLGYDRLHSQSVRLWLAGTAR